MQVLCVCIARALWFCVDETYKPLELTGLLVLFLIQVLESFKIMDYSLLLGIHILDHCLKEKEEDTAQNAPDAKRPGMQKVLYSTAMESIQGPGKSGDGVITENPDTYVQPPAHRPSWLGQPTSLSDEMQSCYFHDGSWGIDSYLMLK